MENDPPVEEELLDQLREMPVGVNDPNIIGDAGPTDVPPGSDPPRAPRQPAEEAVGVDEEAPGWAEP